MPKIIIKPTTVTPLSRRQLLSRGLSAVALGVLPGLTLARTPTTFRIGYIAPASGPLAIFSEPDDFVIQQFMDVVGPGVIAAGQRWPVEILRRDCESRADKARHAAQELIASGVDLVLASTTPECTNPVADVCEAAGIPCLTTISPWQAWYFGRGAKPGDRFRWSFHFFFGLEDIIASYLSLWQPLEVKGAVGVLWPDDDDGHAFANPDTGFPPALKEAGYAIVDPGRFSLQGEVNYAAMVSQFKSSNVEIVTGALPPPFFIEFWKECLRQQFKPKAVTVAKAVEFPEALMPFKRDASGITSLVWWSPKHPWKSGMTGQSADQLAHTYMQASQRNWTMPLGIKHALFEIALDVLRRSGGPGRPDALREALATTSYDSMVGHIDFNSGPVANVSKTALVCGQWDYQFRYLELLIVDNKGAEEVPKQARIRPMS